MVISLRFKFFHAHFNFLSALCMADGTMTSYLRTRPVVKRRLSSVSSMIPSGTISIASSFRSTRSSFILNGVGRLCRYVRLIIFLLFGARIKYANLLGDSDCFFSFFYSLAFFFLGSQNCNLYFTNICYEMTIRCINC